MFVSRSSSGRDCVTWPVRTPTPRELGRGIGLDRSSLVGILEAERDELTFAGCLHFGDLECEVVTSYFCTHT